MRPAEVYYLQGDSSLAQQKLGWKPKIDFHALVKMMVSAELERLERAEKKS
jgi:GDPmannose 4,6-dehydratase